MEKPLDARIKRSRTAIIEAGLECLNQNNEASLTDIANQAGVGRATLYRLFETKEQLISAIAEQCLHSFDTATEHVESEADSALDAIRLLFIAIMPLSSQLQFLMNLDNLMDTDPALQAIYKRQKQEMADIIELAKQEGSIKQSIPTLWIVNLIDNLFYPAWLMISEEGYSDREVAELAFNTLCKGIT